MAIPGSDQSLKLSGFGSICRSKELLGRGDNCFGLDSGIAPHCWDCLDCPHFNGASYCEVNSLFYLKSLFKKWYSQKVTSLSL